MFQTGNVVKIDSELYIVISDNGKKYVTLIPLDKSNMVRGIGTNRSADKTCGVCNGAGGFCGFCEGTGIIRYKLPTYDEIELVGQNIRDFIINNISKSIFGNEK